MSMSSDEEAVVSISSDSGVCADRVGPTTRGGAEIAVTGMAAVRRKPSVCNFKRIGKCIP